MLRSRTRRYDARAAYAFAMVMEIEASIVTLADEDLLDLADIFAADPSSRLHAMASAEMTKRSLSL